TLNGFVMNNTGLVQSQSGMLSLNQGGNVAGTYNAVGATAIVNFGGGTHVVTNGAVFTASSGGYHQCNAGNLNFEIAFTFNPTFQLNASGVLAGSQNVNFTGPFNWLGGTMSGVGTTIITNTGTFAISGGAYTKILHRNLDLYGNGSYDGAQLFYGGQS